MKRNSLPIAGLIATAFAASAAFAQTKASTPPGATPTQDELAATAAASGSAPVARDQVKAGLKPKPHVALPKASPDSTAARADVKAEAKAAARAGETVKGEAAVSARHSKGGAAGTTQGQEMGTTAAREDVRKEAKDAAHAGEVPKGEADVKIKP